MVEHINRLHSRIHRLRYIDKPGTEVYVKREDELGFGISGTKVRKYLSLFAHLKNQGKAHAVVVGGAYSNNVLGLSQRLIEKGIMPHVFLRGAPPAVYKGNLLLTALLVPPKQRQWVSRAQWPQAYGRALQYAKSLPGPAIVLPEGVCMVEALPGALTLGADVLYNEVAAQVVFDHIFIEAGTGLAAIGLLLALRAEGRKVAIHVLLLATTQGAFLAMLAYFYAYYRHMLPKILTWEVLVENVYFYRSTIAPSFGATNRKVFEVIAHIARIEGILTDPIYTAKLFSTAQHIILEEAQIQGKILLVHSGGGLALMGFQAQLATCVAR